MLDESLRLAFRNFATLFLLVAAVTVPLHIAQAFLFRDVVALAELHPAIETFPPERRVRGIGPGDLAAARRAQAIVLLAEVALLPLAVGATRRVLEVDGRGRPPGVVDGWAHSAGGLAHRSTAGRAGAAELAVGALLAGSTGYLLSRGGVVVIEAVAPALRFGPVGLLEGLARAFGAPFVLVPLALLGGRAKDVPVTRPT